MVKFKEETPKSEFEETVPGTPETRTLDSS